MNELEIARQGATFVPARLSNLIHRPGHRERRDRVLAILQQDRLFDKDVKHNQGHTQLLHRALAVCRKLLDLRFEHKWDALEWREALRLQDEPLPVNLHEGAFIKVLESQASDEQQAKWLPLCEKYQIIGCYAQTEMAHGSNIQGLETEARFDIQKGGFYIHSPREQSKKWWVGALGVTATHAVVQAILKIPIKGSSQLKTLGPHLFIVQLRDLATHETMPGMTIGDIGPKAYGGYSGLDNGHARFDNVFIPLENMLMRHSKLTKDGIYTAAKHDKLAYGSMVYLRAQMPEGMGWALARAVTIATRYTTVRRQFNAKDGLETQVITYESVKNRLVPQLARSYAFIFAGRELITLYDTMLDRLIKKNDVEMLAEVHILSTSLKVAFTWDAIHGIEESRKVLGGHGYSVFSGIGQIFANLTPAQTYEGDNYVIAQQTARALMKHFGKLTDDPGYKLSPSYDYLKLVKIGMIPKHTLNAKSSKDWMSEEAQVLALSLHALAVVSSLAEKVEDGAVRDISWESARVTRAHSTLFTVRAFWSACNNLSNMVANNVKEELRIICQFYSLSSLLSPTTLADLLEFGILTTTAVSNIRAAYNALLDHIGTPETMVGLTDAFDFSDFEMGSALGCYDGKVYERLWAAVKAETNRGVARGENWLPDVRKLTSWWEDSTEKKKEPLAYSKL